MKRLKEVTVTTKKSKDFYLNPIRCVDNKKGTVIVISEEEEVFYPYKIIVSVNQKYYVFSSICKFLL